MQLPPSLHSSSPSTIPLPHPTIPGLASGQAASLRSSALTAASKSVTSMHSSPFVSPAGHPVGTASQPEGLPSQRRATATTRLTSATLRSWSPSQTHGTCAGAAMASSRTSPLAPNACLREIGLLGYAPPFPHSLPATAGRDLPGPGRTCQASAAFCCTVAPLLSLCTAAGAIGIHQDGAHANAIATVVIRALGTVDEPGWRAPASDSGSRRGAEMRASKRSTDWTERERGGTLASPNSLWETEARVRAVCV